MSDAMHRREHSGLAWHDDPDGGEREAERARPWPVAGGQARPDDDGLRVLRSTRPEPAPRWHDAPGGGGWRPGHGGPWPEVDDRGAYARPGVDDRDAHRHHDVEDRPHTRRDPDDLQRRLDQLPPPLVRDDRRPPAPTVHAPPDEVGQHSGDGRGAVEPPDDAGHEQAPLRHEIEESVPASARLRAAAERASVRVRRSVPLRTALFVLPPLLLPPALGLSLGASLVVTLLLLWLAAAAALLATIMFDGSDQLALRAIDRRLQALEVAGGGRPSPTATPTAATPAAPAPTASRPAGDTEDALLAIGSQLDRLNDRLDDLAADRPRAGRPDDHRSAEQWSGQPHPGQDGSAADGGTRQWDEQRWQGGMR